MHISAGAYRKQVSYDSDNVFHLTNSVIASKNGWPALINCSTIIFYSDFIKFAIDSVIIFLHNEKYQDKFVS